MIMDNQEMRYTYSELEEFIINYRSGDALKLLVYLLNNNKSVEEKLFEKAMIYYYVESDIKCTLKQLDYLLEVNSDYFEALLLKGEILAGIHKYDEAIWTLNNIHPNMLPYGYKKLIEYISEYDHKSTAYYCVLDFDSSWVYFYIESQNFKRLSNSYIDFLQQEVVESGLIWEVLDINLPNLVKENIPVISGIRLSEEEPTNNLIKDNVENCIICGKKLNFNQKNLCKSCMKKQYASRIIKKLVSIVKPEIVFKKEDLKLLNLDDIQIQDYIWTLQEFDLIEVDNNKLELKDKTTLNNFRIESKMEPIDFDSLSEENMLNKTCKTCGKTLPISYFYKSSEGYEDNCKICKKHINTARYLEDILGFVGFDNEFDENILNEYIPNKNQIIGMIWSLQDNDLLIEKEDKTYVLVNQSNCLDYLSKYDPDFDFNKMEIKSKPNVKIKSKSNSKHNVDLKKLNKEYEQINRSKFKKDSKVNEKEKQMKIVLDARKKGKSREDAANIAGIPLYKINHWYKEGKQGFGKDNISFYKKLKKIENNLSYSLDLDERKQMNFVLKLLRQGKSIDEIAKLAEIEESTINSWCDGGKKKSSKNTIYFLFEFEKIKETNRKKAESKKLKVQIKDFIPKFIELDEKIVETNIDSYEMSFIRQEIKSNIEFLKSSSRLRRIDKLENRLSEAKKSYKLLSKKVDDELIKINKSNKSMNVKKYSTDNLEELIKENARTIIDLRNKYGQNYSINNKLTEISLLNSKLNSNFKNGKNVELDEVLNVKSSLNEIMIDLDYSFKSDDDPLKSSNDNLTESVNLKNTVDENNELLDYLYSITGSNYGSLKVSFISCLVNNNLSVKEGMEIRDVLVNEIEEGKLKTPDEIQFRLNELIIPNSSDSKEYLLDFLYGITGGTSFPKSSFVNTLKSNYLSVREGMLIQNILINEIDKGKLKTPEDVEFRLNNLIMQERNNKEILLVLYDITGKSSILKSSFVSTLKSNNLSVSDGKEIKNILINEIENGMLETPDDIRSRLNNLIEQKSRHNKKVSLDFLYGITGGDSSLKSSYVSMLTSNNLSVSEGMEIKNILISEIEGGILTPGDVRYRLNNLIEQKSRHNKKVLLDFLYDITGGIRSLKSSFVSTLESNNLTVKAGEKIQIFLINEIKEGKLKNTDEINQRLDDLIKQHANNVNDLINYLHSLTDDKKHNFYSTVSIIDYLDQDEINVINEKIENEIKAQKFKSKKDIKLRFNKLISKKKKEKSSRLLEQFYEIVGKDNISNSFLKILSDKGLTPASGIYVRSVVETEIRDYSIKNIAEINKKIDDKLDEEILRQDKSMNKLNEIYDKDNIYLMGLSFDEKEDVKSIVVKSIKENRLNFFDVYSEFKKVVLDFKKTHSTVVENEIKDDESKDINDENESSGGFISKLKRFFSRK